MAGDPMAIGRICFLGHGPPASATRPLITVFWSPALKSAGRKKLFLPRVLDEIVRCWRSDLPSSDSPLGPAEPLRLRVYLLIQNFSSSDGVCPCLGT